MSKEDFLKENGWEPWYNTNNWIKKSWRQIKDFNIEMAGMSVDDAYAQCKAEVESHTYDPSTNKSPSAKESNQDERIKLLENQVQELVRVSGVQAQYLKGLRQELEWLKKPYISGVDFGEGEDKGLFNCDH